MKEIGSNSNPIRPDLSVGSGQPENPQPSSVGWRGRTLIFFKSIPLVGGLVSLFIRIATAIKGRFFVPAPPPEYRPLQDRDIKVSHSDKQAQSARNESAPIVAPLKEIDEFNSWEARNCSFRSMQGKFQYISIPAGNVNNPSIYTNLIKEIIQKFELNCKPSDVHLVIQGKKVENNDELLKKLCNSPHIETEEIIVCVKSQAENAPATKGNTHVAASKPQEAVSVKEDKSNSWEGCEINCKDMGGKQITGNIPAGSIKGLDPYDHLIRQIAEQKGVDPSRIRLILAGQELNKNSLLEKLVNSPNVLGTGPVLIQVRSVRK